MTPQPSAPQRPIRRNGTFDTTVTPPLVNEAIMLRLPFAITLGPPSIISSGMTGATNSNYHLCFVSGRIIHQDPNSVQLSVWICLGFSSAIPDCNTFVRSLSAGWQACLLPVPFALQTPPLVRLPTPVGFGDPLQIGAFIARKPCFLNIRPVPVMIGRNTAFKRFDPPGFLTAEEVLRLDTYRFQVASPALPLQLTETDHSDRPSDDSANGDPTPGSAFPGSKSGVPPTTPGTGPAVLSPSSSGPPTTKHNTVANDLMDLWYPRLHDMIYADDMGSDSDLNEDQQSAMSFVDYARMFGAYWPEAQAVVDQADATDAAARAERIEGWRLTVDCVGHGNAG